MPDGAIAEPAGSGADDAPCPTELVTDSARLRQRAVFLRELADARAMLTPAARWRRTSVGVRQRLRQDASRV